jgi:hypothetical protein
MAREAGFWFDHDYQMWLVKPKQLAHFEALVRADEAEKYKWDVHSCGPTCTKVACVGLREAVQSEREACAKVCDVLAVHPEYASDITKLAASAIRARAVGNRAYDRYEGEIT